ncbi:MAG: D-glycerate dehydrogenase [Bacteroidota bacterium]
MKVFISRKLPGKPELHLRRIGFNVNSYLKDEAIPNEEFLRHSKDVDAIITSLTEKVDRKFIDSLRRCKIIANCAVGYNNIDVKYARSKGIVVTNTPDVLTNATADITSALILASARRLREGELIMRNNKSIIWQAGCMLGIELNKKILGIIGAGRIGSAVAKRMHAFGMRIVYFNRSKNEQLKKMYGARKVSLKKLLMISDVISVHLPLNESTFHFLDKDRLKLLKQTSILVNTSRGEVIDESELIKLLKKRKIFAAGLDVFEGEPYINPELHKLDNVFLLPHIGSATKETREAMSLLCVKNVVNVLKGKKPLTPVN